MRNMKLQLFTLVTETIIDTVWQPSLYHHAIIKFYNVSRV